MRDWLRSALAIFQKDVLLEFRTRFSINALLLFILASVFLLSLAIGPVALSPEISSGLLWVVILFSAVIGLGRAFVSEEERGTVLLLQLNATPGAVYTGKLFFNLALSVTMHALAVVAFWLILDFRAGSPGALVLIVLLGAIGFAGATTLLSAIIARTVNRGPLLAILAFPILVPLLLSVIQGTNEALRGGSVVDVSPDLLVLIGYAGAVITVSALLFEYVWNE
jgi:heme exporter protein B